MTRLELAQFLDVDVVLSMAAAFGIGWFALRASGASGIVDGPASSSSRDSRRESGASTPIFAHPLTQFALCLALVFVNQLAFNVYVVRVHHGDPSFVARYVGSGWFDVIPRHPLVRILAQHVGSGTWLAPSVLRVQAFLELPLVVFAYLTVSRALSIGLYRRLTSIPVLIPMALSFSVTFSLIEIVLANPWTNDDLVLRAAACLLVPPYVAWLGRRDRARGQGAQDLPGLVGLFAFLGVAASIAYVILAAYDALLLYNLAHAPRYIDGVAIAFGVLGVSSFVLPRFADRLRALGGVLTGRSPVLDAARTGLAAFTLLFFVPSLAIRYAALRPIAFLAGATLVAIGLFVGIGALLRPRRRTIAVAGEGARRDDVDGSTGRRFVGVAACIFGLVAGSVVVACLLAVLGFGSTFGFTPSRIAIDEALLARVAITFLAVFFVAMRVFEAVVGDGEGRCRAH